MNSEQMSVPVVFGSKGFQTSVTLDGSVNRSIFLPVIGLFHGLYKKVSTLLLSILM
jgi:hypothetical protein